MTHQDCLLFVKVELASQDYISRLTVLQSLLEGLYERHSLLHLTHLADPAVERLVVNLLRVGCGIPDLAKEVDILRLPCGE